MNTAQEMDRMYRDFGISPEVAAYGRKIEALLKERFDALDQTAEYNQWKVINAMQKNRVNAECLSGTTGYGYDDFGRDTLEKVYADCFRGRSRSGQAADYLRYPRAGAGPDVQSAPGRRALIAGGKTLRHAGGSHRHPPLPGIPGRVRDYLRPGGSSGRRLFRLREHSKSHQ